jgi:hypothetical protein
MNENHLRYKTPSPRPIGMGSYNMDSHNVQRYVDENGHVRNEGDIQRNPGGPYPIDYGAIIPKKAQVENLLVPVALSSSHIAYGSARMEPVFMILGQSAATAVSLAIDAKLAVQDVPYERLSKKLLEDKQVLHYTKVRRRPRNESVQNLKGIVVDDAQASGNDGWTRSSAQGSFAGSGYRHDENAKKGKLEAIFKTTKLEDGKYVVRIGYSAWENRASNVPVKVAHADGITKFTVNQKKKPGTLNFLHELGAFRFEKGKPASVTVGNAGTDGYVVIDCVQWLPTK